MSDIVKGELSEPIKAVVLGVVEGLTEFLPVSSTGHLILFGEYLQFTGEKAHSFEVIIQVGAILSVILLYFGRFKGLFADGFSLKRLFAPGLYGAAGLGKLALVTAPALVAGLLLHKTIKAHLFAPLPVATALIIGGIVILWVERSRSEREGVSADEITSRQALVIGCLQCLAMWPGMSRSGTVIIAAMLLGLNRRAATEFSFLAAVPVLTAAAAKDLVDALPGISADFVQLLLIGLVVSFFTALITVKAFTALVSKMTLAPFGVYRLALGAFVVWVTLSAGSKSPEARNSEVSINGIEQALSDQSRGAVSN